MSFSVGIIGPPNIGKSTLFKALTKKKVDIAAYPFTTIHPNFGIVAVPDQRLKKIAEIVKPEKVTPTIIEFVDIAGLVRGAHKGEGLGNQFLAHIRNCDALVEIVRAFSDPKVEHVEGEINPERDIEIIKVELLMKDLESLENLLKKFEKNVKVEDKNTIKKFEILKKFKEVVSQGKLISELHLTEEEVSQIKESQLLTQKPIVYLINIKNEKSEAKLQELKNKYQNLLIADLKIEEEISELSPDEIKELELKSLLEPLILNCYNILELITFFTITGGKEVRAWTLEKGEVCPQAGKKVHSDFKEKFIKAEVISWKSLIEADSWSKAKELGWIKIVGRDYVVQDGDVIEFKI